jgi:hypothetical protein
MTLKLLTIIELYFKINFESRPLYSKNIPLFLYTLLAKVISFLVIHIPKFLIRFLEHTFMVDQLRFPYLFRISQNILFLSRCQ